MRKQLLLVQKFPPESAFRQAEKNCKNLNKSTQENFTLRKIVFFFISNKYFLEKTIQPTSADMVSIGGGNGDCKEVHQTRTWSGSCSDVWLFHTTIRTFQVRFLKQSLIWTVSYPVILYICHCILCYYISLLKINLPHFTPTERRRYKLQG